MAEAKFINNAARILKLVQAGMPADQALRESLTQDRHYTAPLERREISRAVFAYYRWWRWLDPKDSLQKQLEAVLVLRDRFTKNPASIKTEALAARAVPDWIKAEMESLPGAWLQQLQHEPELWIRAKQGLQEKVAAALKDCQPFPATGIAAPGSVSAVALAALGSQLSAFRYSGITDLYRTAEFQSGAFEIQDLSSQLVSHACAPRPGETWWDACAGEGGKTMHLSDLMQNKGLLWASDRSTRRLAKLKARAARAQVFNFRAAPWEGGAHLPTKTKFDGVLVDAPCSGIGTWQRNPHARWTTLPKDVSELAAVQGQLLNHVAPSLKPGGRLVYAVCTLSRAETTSVADAFAAAHPEFFPVAPFPAAGASSLDPKSQTPAPILLWPQDLNANGMYIAAWRRR